jgi:type IV pilus assembly protein PilP
MKRRVAWLIVLIVAVMTATAAFGQTAAAKPAAPPTQAAPAQPPAAPPAEAYTYNPEGRRDPFISMLLRGFDLRGGPMTRPEGVPGLLISEVTVRGIVKSPKGFIAMLISPDNKTYIVRPNDRLFDGTIRAITVDAVVFLQEVNDPLSLVKQREVRKPLRALQEGK